MSRTSGAVGRRPISEPLSYRPQRRVELDAWTFVSFLRKAKRVPTILSGSMALAVLVAETLGDEGNGDEQKIGCSTGGAVVELDARTRIILCQFGKS